MLAQANPYLVSFDLRVHGTNAKEAYVSKGGDIVTLDLFATVFQTGPSFIDDGFQSTMGALRSSSGGLQGDLLGLTGPSPFNAGSRGVQSDSDGDGDLDIGVNTNTYYYPRASGPAFNNSPATEFFIGQTQFTATSLAAPSTEISYIPTVYKTQYLNYGVLLYNEGKPKALTGNDSRVFVNSPVTIRANQVNDPGAIQYISGIIPQHLSVTATVMPAVGSSVSLTGGIDVAAPGMFDARTGANSIAINDLTSANNGGSIFVPSFSVATTAPGVFAQSNGVTSVSSSLDVGSVNFTGTLNIGGGSISAPTVTVASGSSIHQTGANATFSTLYVNGAGAQLLVDDGSLSAENVQFHQGGAGIINGGTFTINGRLAVGNDGSGSLTINGGTVLASSLTVGLKSIGSVIQNNGDVRGIVQVGRIQAFSQPGTSTYTLNGGTITGALFVSTSSSSLFIQNGGLVTGEVLQGLVVRAPSPARASYELHSGVCDRPGVTYIAWDEFNSLVGRSYTGTGSLSQSGGSARLGTLNIGKNGLYTLSGGNLTINKTLAHYGTLDFANSAATLTAGATSFLDFSHGQITSATNATVTGLAGSLINFASGYDPLVSIGHFTSNGLVHINGQPLTIPANTAVHGSGTLEGDVINNGTLSPGNSPGELDIVGNFAHTALANLEIELAGTTSYLFDLVTATGTATLQGMLTVDLLGDYIPLATDRFPILTAANITGSFSNATTGIDIAAGHFDVLYSPTAVTLANFSPVPEPTVALFVLAVPLLLRRRRNL